VYSDFGQKEAFLISKNVIQLGSTLQFVRELYMTSLKILRELTESVMTEAKTKRPPKPKE